VISGSLLPGGSAAPFDVCRVVGVVSPAINFEVWMPVTGWNGKFNGVGNGGLAGSISYDAMRTALARGYATASTDTGHPQDQDGHWAQDRPDLLIDFAYRSIHEMTRVTKAIIGAYYGQSPDYSYFTGCSGGGGQALSEAQRFPADYDGIVAGAPANLPTHMWPGELYPSWLGFTYGTAVSLTYAGPGPFPPGPPPAGLKLTVLNQAVMAACDTLDGVADGIIGDPRNCSYDPQALLCPGANDYTCLTQAEIDTVKKVYVGLQYPSTGQQFWYPYEQGSETGWSGHLADPPFFIPPAYFKYMIGLGSGWDWKTFSFTDTHNFTATLDPAHYQLGPILDSTNADLSAFKGLGGKLVMYHGWNDQNIAPRNSINYYNSVINAIGGEAETQSFLRLFMAPGMEHCQGGVGPNTFDSLGALEKWVEQSAAPTRIIATNSTRGITRPLCPYPQVARYVGSGSTNDAANFNCTMPTSETCNSLMGLSLTDTTIITATDVAAGPIVVGGRTYTLTTSMCRVTGVVTPAINFEVWLPPISGDKPWNGKFNGVGNGGLAGSLSYDAMVVALNSGYATASTDTGHPQDQDGHWAQDRPDLLIDFAYRSIHEMTRVAKAVIEAYYGQAPNYSYFTGCSGGGGQALSEAQRFPADYNGIVAGAPANLPTHMWPGELYPSWLGFTYGTAVSLTYAGPGPFPPGPPPAGLKLTVLNQAVMAACDTLDGVADGIIGAPRNCSYDPQALLCPGTNDYTCLTQAEIDTVKKVYVGLQYPSTGQQFWYPYERGSETGWSGHLADPPFFIPPAYFKYMVGLGSSWDWHTFSFTDTHNFTATLDPASYRLGPILDSTNADLSPFKGLGGKLVMYHGWNDQNIAPRNSINYYNSVMDVMGSKAETQNFLRLFMAPGMGHCSGGVGPNTFDSLTPLAQWVENGTAPAQITASNSVRGITRPLCPYPQVAQYDGSGSTDDAANFGCANPIWAYLPLIIRP
jgi:feruloyl esterase